MENSSSRSKSIDPKMVETLIEATAAKRIKWVRLSDYSYCAENNGALNHYIQLYYRGDPKSVDDIESMDIGRSYCVTYQGVTFAILSMKRVEGLFKRLAPYFRLIVQATPYQMFAGSDEHQEAFARLSVVAEESAIETVMDWSMVSSALNMLKSSL